MKRIPDQLNIVTDTYVSGKEAHVILAMAFIGGVTFAAAGVTQLVKAIRKSKPLTVNLINEEHLKIMEDMKK